MEEIIGNKIENPEAKPNFSKLDSILNDVKSAENDSAGFMQPGQKQKSKRGRPSKEEQAKKAQAQKSEALYGKPQDPSQPQAQATPAGIPSKEIAKPVALFISNMGVSYVGDPRASMTPDELESMAMALGLCLDKYMPLVMSKYGPEAMLAITLGQYGLRLMAMKKYLEIEKQKQNQKDIEKMKEEPKPESIFNENQQHFS